MNQLGPIIVGAAAIAGFAWVRSVCLHQVGWLGLFTLGPACLLATGIVLAVFEKTLGRQDCQVRMVVAYVRDRFQSRGRRPS